MADATDQGAHEMAYLPPNAPPLNHGHTSAAWTTVLFAVAGAAIAAVGVLLPLMWLFWVGIGVAGVGIVTGKIMAVLGYGQLDPNEAKTRKDAA